MADQREARFRIEGMHCAGCVNRLTTTLKKLGGVDVKEVQVGSAAVRYDASSFSAQTIADAINRIGFRAELEA